MKIRIWRSRWRRVQRAQTGGVRQRKRWEEKEGGGGGWWGGVMWEWPDPQVEYKVTTGAGRHSVLSPCLRVPAFSRQSERMRVGGTKWRLDRDTSGLTSELGNSDNTHTQTQKPDVWHQDPASASVCSHCVMTPLEGNCGFSAFSHVVPPPVTYRGRPLSSRTRCDDGESCTAAVLLPGCVSVRFPALPIHTVSLYLPIVLLFGHSVVLLLIFQPPPQYLTALYQDMHVIRIF